MMSFHKTIVTYVNKYDLCSGCGLCEALFENKVHVDINESGFYRPVFADELDEAEANKFKSMCPCLNMNSEACDDSLFGKIIESKVSWSTDDEVRYKASSGGSVTSFLCYLLKENVVDGVIHISKGPNELSCKASISRNEEQVKKAMGSLYMPSSLLKNINDIIKPDETYAFVGKGCDIRAMKSYIVENRSALKIAVYVGIMCGGTPSIRGTYSILNQANISAKEVVELRYRGYGWPGYFCVKSKSSEYQLSYNDAWAKYLGPTSSLACKICFDGIAESADITFGDAWYCDSNNYPVFEEQNGRNLALIRSDIGRALFYDSCKKGYLSVEDLKIDNTIIERMQPSQANRRYLAAAKFFGLKLIGYKYPRANLKKLIRITHNKKVPLIQFVRTSLGTIRRANKHRK